MGSRLLLGAMVIAGLGGCGPNPSSYADAGYAGQQANKVQQGVVVGVRGIAARHADNGSASATTVLDGLAGPAAQPASTDTAAFEYIVRKPTGALVSVTQRDKAPLGLGMKVLVIAGDQARVVPDGIVPADVAAKAARVSPTPEPGRSDQRADAAAGVVAADAVWQHNANLTTNPDK